MTLHAQDASGFTAEHPFDLVLCVGATHAFGGLLPTLEAVRRHLAPGGTALIGGGFWEREPNRRTVDAGFADDHTDLGTTVDRTVADGWTPVYGHISTTEEWDDYEWACTGTASRWALDNPDDPDSRQVFTAAAEHRATWLHGYRRTLGFATPLLRRTPDHLR